MGSFILRQLLERFTSSTEAKYNPATLRSEQIGGASAAILPAGDDEIARGAQIRAAKQNSPHSSRRRLLQRLLQVKNVHKLFHTSRRRSRFHNSRHLVPAPIATTPRRDVQTEHNDQAKGESDTEPTLDEEYDEQNKGKGIEQEREGLSQKDFQLRQTTKPEQRPATPKHDTARTISANQPKRHPDIGDEIASHDETEDAQSDPDGISIGAQQTDEGTISGSGGLLSLAARSKVQPTSTAKTRRAFQETIKRNEEVRTKRLMKELRDIQKIVGSQKYPAFTVELMDSNLFEWYVRLHQVDPESALARDMLELGVPCVEMCFEFPDNFPFLPPFVRVLSPHIEKGFVMEGGAICLELLTPAGWASAYTVEAIIVQVTAALSKGQARINVQPKASKQFSRKLAEMSFKSLVKTHNKYGWVTPPKSDG
ncbi:ubiquitin-conjugating enzyme E2 Q2-like [Varroa jacobsoni]|uniref:ubiquitin-conjugating enzyme E2 Q2-like n=1 Tax=Varroa jacobsoni TaxID=62625 RepID=UPI000BF3FEBC|nr:ubiquitin-conjugating enzyme E2 Q2-like [Varroa jacobsoni]